MFAIWNSAVAITFEPQEMCNSQVAGGKSFSPFRSERGVLIAANFMNYSDDFFR